MHMKQKIDIKWRNEKLTMYFQFHHAFNAAKLKNNRYIYDFNYQEIYI